MPGQFGNKGGGRRPLGLEVKDWLYNKTLEEVCEEIAEAGYYALAEDIKRAVKEGGLSDKEYDRIKNLVLPILLKSRPDKQNIKVEEHEYKQLTDEQLAKIARGEKGISEKGVGEKTS